MQANDCDCMSRMNEIMRRKLSLLHEIHDLASQAFNYISEECAESLDNLMNEKQGLMAEIDRLDKQFLLEFGKFKAAREERQTGAPGGSQPPDLHELRSAQPPELHELRSAQPPDLHELRSAQPPELYELRAYTGEILSLLIKTEALDQAFAQGVKKLRDSVSSDLARIRRQKQASGLYASDGADRRKKTPMDYAPVRNIDIKK